MASCQYQPACPGCPRFGDESLPATTELLQSLTRKYHGPELQLLPGKGQDYRHRVRLSVRAGAQGPELGLFERASHRLVSIPDCPIHHPTIRALHALLAESLQRHGVEAYDEARHRGVLRAVQLAVERSTGAAQVVLIVRDKLGPGSFARQCLLGVLDDLRAAPRLVHSVWLNAQPERTNTLLGAVFEHVLGPDCLEDESGGARVFYPPSAFGQANPWLHDQAVALIHEFIPTGSKVVEFHGGVGAIGLGLAGRCDLVVNELGAGSLEGLGLGIAALPVQLALPRIEAGPADDHVGLLAQAEAVIVDPPRKGLSAPLLEALIQQSVSRLAYLSCGLDSFLGDAERLLGSGQYQLESLSALGYFPYTDHIETLGLFKKRQASGP